MHAAFKDINMAGLSKLISKQLSEMQTVSQFFNPFRVLMERPWGRPALSKHGAGNVQRFIYTLAAANYL
jgi:hypothetical protein